ncbi:probable protein phosphatase 2C 8 [Ananas comosus]|uniref:protein-serine/threonine phosphatase n=1 Tax=Ananas comosus TaxID=4615 RepID=A0A6P5FPG8_ANACO|nr:probable protein phosphatase 2C 8 [Ananas comosus]
MENKTRDSDNKKDEDKGERAVPVCCGEELEGAPCKVSSSSARRRRAALRRMKSEALTGSAKRLRNREAKPDSPPPSSSSSSSSSSSPSSSSSSPTSAASDPDGEGPAVGILAAAAAAGIGFPSLSHGEVSVIGRRREMEDAVTVALGFAGSPEAAAGYDFFGVYDGHGGARVAQACRDRMHVVLAEEAAKRRRRRRATPVKGEEEMEMEMAMAMALGDDEEDEELGRWRAAMAASFARVDGEVSEAAEGGGSGAAEKTVGSTAVVAVVGARRIVVANCGDSRAVLSRGGVAVPLSSDHKPDRPDEMERVEAAGGRVINWNGYRVLGVLATSRSIGDYYLKPYVISEPEINVMDRTDKDEFLILATDGLWDVVSNEVACKITRNCLSGRMAAAFPDAVSGRTAADAAALLVELAMSRGSKDNISVVVVELRRLHNKSR